MNEISPDVTRRHNLAKAYLSLPRDYVDQLGGLRWSDEPPGLCLGDSDHVVEMGQIAAFIEGFASQRDLIAFGAIVHWLTLLGKSGYGGSRTVRWVSQMGFDYQAAFDRLQHQFAAAGGNWRNAGVLAATVCADAASAAYAPDPKLICERLRDTAFPLTWFTGLLNGHSIKGETPPMPPADFEAHVAKWLGQLSDADLQSWLKFGRGPLIDAGKQLVVEPPPRSWGDIVQALLQRPRLGGAQPYVDQLVSALAVPPRRKDPQQLPMGGYVDVITRGTVDRMLPSQHALDDLEFLRRFSENELLYFRREEPPAAQREDKVIVLDQGVRTWGDVRLVLAAAALALATRAHSRAIACWLACTSQAGLIDPQDVPAEALGRLLEASDLSPNPGLALESVLEKPSEVPRDLFLLTHPFALAEEAVRTAALRLGPQDRLFALTVNAKGAAELSELRHGLPVRLRSFRIDFVAAATPHAKPAAAPSGWTGPLEADPWPFPFRPDSPVVHYDFDAGSRYLYAILKNGKIHVWEIATGKAEIVPRPIVDGATVKQWHATVGVPNGFALVTVNRPDAHLYHYDLVNRTCKHYQIADILTAIEELHYIPSHNALAIFAMGANFLVSIFSLSLGTALENDPRNGPIFEVAGLWKFGRCLQQLPGEKAVDWPGYHVDSNTGKIALPGWRPFICLDEDTRTTSGRVPIAICLANGVAGATTKAVNNYTIHFFQGPNGDFLRRLVWQDHGSPNPVPDRETVAANMPMISPNGEMVAICRTGLFLEVHATRIASRVLFCRTATIVNMPRLWFGKSAFLLNCGGKGYCWHLVTWGQKFAVHSEVNREASVSKGGFANPTITRALAAGDLMEARGVSGGNDAIAEFADVRGFIVWLDKHGRVSIYTSSNQPIFQFWGYGDSWTAWLPGDIRLGRGSIHQWPDTPGAAEAMQRALAAAGDGERR